MILLQKNKQCLEKTKLVFLCDRHLQGGVFLKQNIPIEVHASEVYTRTMFEKFGEILYKAGQYRVEEVEKGSKYYVHRYHTDKHEK